MCFKGGADSLVSWTTEEFISCHVLKREALPVQTERARGAGGCRRAQAGTGVKAPQRTAAPWLRLLYRAAGASTHPEVPVYPTAGRASGQGRPGLKPQHGVGLTQGPAVPLQEAFQEIPMRFEEGGHCSPPL